MQVNILHDGALTVELESNGTVTSKVGGKVPTLDDIARQRAKARYMAGESAHDLAREYKPYIDRYFAQCEEETDEYEEVV